MTIKIVHRPVPAPYDPDPADKFEVHVDHAKRVITIQGINYAFDFFNHIAFGGPGTILMLGPREDGVRTFHQVDQARNVK